MAAWKFDTTVIVAMIVLTLSSSAQPSQIQPRSYTAEFKVTKESVLADGSTGLEKIDEVRARDAQGRIMTSATTGALSSITQVTVFDPIARTYMSWSAPGNLVVITPLPGMAQLLQNCAGKDGTANTPHARIGVSKPTHVDLGKATIAGVEARGSREKQTTLVVGAGGSSRVTRMREIWLATDPALGFWIVKMTIDDPGIEKFTKELVRFDQYEPYPTIFHPPQGYQIVSQQSNQAPCSAAVEPELLKPPPW